MTKKSIRGFGGGGGKGGGGGGGRVAQESPDSLRSIAYAQVLDLVSEGEIEGLANGLKSVFFDETPLQNENGSFNFTGATVVSTNGTQSQSYIQGFPAVESENVVGVQVEYATPITRQITNTEVDAVRVRVSIPQLTKQNTSNGDIGGSTVQYAIEIQSDGGGYVPQIIGSTWSSGAVTIASSTSAQANQTVYQIQMGVIDTSNEAVYVAQYKLQSDSTWLTDGISEATDRTTNSWTDGDGNYQESSQTVKTFTMPVKDAGLWEMRIVITSGSPYIGTVNGNYGTPYATINGKTTSKYERSHRIELTGDAPWDIRVRRITADSSSSALQDKTFWESYTEIVDGKFRYPNSAIIGVRIDASQFDNIPKRSYDLKLLKVKVPSNYDVNTRAYTGIWDGTFKVSWTDNPAWCFYDLLTNTRYGLGDFIPEAQVDKWTLYAIGKYCDELVPNGFGGTEPRYTCNMYLQNRQEAYTVLNNMASVFRGMPYWSSGSITLGYDAPSDPVYQFNNANVIDGTFNYVGSALKARHTVALVTWNDPDDFFRQKVEYVEDADGIARFGIIQTEVVAVGCSSRGQANRVGRWILYTEQSETEAVNFKTGLEGHSIRPSQVIQVADKDRAGTRMGGRISSASTSVINVDQNVTSISGLIDGTLSVILPNGTLETKSIANVSGTSITVESAFSDTPLSGSVWMVQTESIALQTFRVIAAAEEADGISISALAHNPDKYALIEEGLKLQPRAISSLSVTPASPSNIQVSEALYEEGADIKTLVTVSWSPVDGATKYAVSYKVGDRNYVNLPNTSSTSVDIRDAIEGVYSIKIFSINSVNKRSIPSEATTTVYGKTLPPADVEDFSINIIGTQAHLSWSPVGDLDLSHYRIRHSRLTTGATYSDAVDLVFKVSRPAVSIVVPAMTGTYFIKAYDKLDNASINAASSTAIIQDITGLNVVETITESPAFIGEKYECSVGDDGLVLDTALDFDSVSGDFDDVIGLFDGGGGTTSIYGTYDFADILDLGAIYTSRITAYVEVGRIDYVNTFDAKEGDFDTTLGEFDGDPDSFDDTNVELLVSTNDAASSELLYVESGYVYDGYEEGQVTGWTDYRKFFVGDYKAQLIKFRAVLTSSDESASPILKVLRINVDMPDRVIGGNDIISGTAAGGYSVVFSPSFKVSPSIGVMAQNLVQGDYYEIPTKSASGFTIRFKNSGGTVVSRTFDYVAKGYGELVT